MCIIYVRVSTRRQVPHRITDETQLCLKAAAQLGLIVVKTFLDEGASGFNGEREGYKEMAAYIREHPGSVEYLIVPDLSRLSRSMPEYAAFRILTARYGVRIISAREGVVDDSPEGRLIEGTLMLAASYDATVKKELSAKAQKDLVERGLWPFRIPIGYRQGARKGYLVADESAAPGVRRLFELVASEGLAVTDLPSRAAEVNLYRIGKLLSSSAQYRQILVNPLYAGRIILKSGFSGTAAFPPLVASETFDAIQVRLAGRAVVKRRGFRVSLSVDLSSAANVDTRCRAALPKAGTAGTDAKADAQRSVTSSSIRCSSSLPTRSKRNRGPTAI